MVFLPQIIYNRILVEDVMIEFTCHKCGQQLQMADEYEGKECRCPECKEILIVPQLFPPEFLTGNGQPPAEGNAGKMTDRSINFALDLKPKPEVMPSYAEVVEPQLTQKLTEKEKLQEHKAALRRPLLIETLLYPTSIHGLSIIAVIVGIFLIIDLIVTPIINLVAVFLGPLSFIMWALILIIAVITTGYAFWYLGHCVRETAEGDNMAPDVLVDSPSIADMALQFLQTAACLAFFAAPVVVYYSLTGKTDIIFFALLGYAALFLPMGLLSVIINDDIAGLNPVLLVRSIVMTFFSYLKLVVLFYLIGWLMFYSLRFFINLPFYLNFIFNAVLLYFLIMLAHLLGRFYRAKRDKLGWDT